MRTRKSVAAAFSAAFLLALILNFGAAAQNAQTKNQPQRPDTDYSLEFRKARRTFGLKEEFKTAIKNNKAGWELTADNNPGYGGVYLMWELLSNKLIIPDKKVGMSARDFETVSQQAAAEEWSYTQFLGYLLNGELKQRHQMRIQMSLQFARFPYLKRLSEFDFKAQPAVVKDWSRNLPPVDS